MPFNSFQFLIFLPVIIVCYFAVPYHYRWILLLAASYYFYMCWEITYIFLLLTSTLIAYGTGLYMGQTTRESRRRICLIASLSSNLLILFFFKYFNFFSVSIQGLLNSFNIFLSSPTFNLLLPIGISFYTFQTLSYSIDVYRYKKLPEKHLGIFALYVAFFPLILAGPIERSTHLLPQFYRKNDFDYDRFKSGLLLMLWGFFKKLVIADRLAILVNQVYSSPYDYHGLPLIIAAYFFSFQIYCDFSGYSDIAVGSARMMGYDIMINFRQPYFAKSIAEFWRRWHISLSTWFKDYLYIPLGGNKVNQMRWCYNIFIVFLLSGLWHGANWTFFIWGALHGIYIIISRITNKYRNAIFNQLRIPQNSSIRSIFSYLITFHLVTFAWIFFRANTLSDAIYIISNLFSDVKIQLSNLGLDAFEFKIALALICLLTIVQFAQLKNFSYKILIERSRILRWSTYYFLFMGILLLGKFGKSQFIYFQF